MSSSDKIVSREEAAERAKSWTSDGLKIVFTNGCFDLIHLGHVDYLERSRLLGDKLIIGLNSDESVARLKGESRPVAVLESRSRVLAALEFVDLVVVFEEDTPYELIKELQPDILVKGNDYLAENVVGADIVQEKGGEVVTVPLVEGHSTSSIIERIKKS